jgi:hypothetical protein
MSDFSTSFFLTNNSNLPFYPPARFRLPGGESRYSGNCCLEDLQKAGFQGPLAIPDTKPDQTIKWSPELQQFIAISIDYQDLELRKEDKLIRNELTFILATKQDFLANLDSFYEDYFCEKCCYYIKVEAALASNRLLTLKDIPADVLFIANQDQLRVYYEDYKQNNYDSWKLSYETYGIIIYMEERYKPFFKLDSNWVKGSEPLPDGLTPPFAFDFRNVT